MQYPIEPLQIDHRDRLNWTEHLVSELNNNSLENYSVVDCDMAKRNYNAMWY